MCGSIKPIFKNQLCTGCGTCVAFCPEKALTMQENMQIGIYMPVFYIEKCNNCGLCIKICPGASIDLPIKNAECEFDQYLGNYYKCYIGRSLNSKIFNKGSSGGVISQLLIYLLKTGKIDGAIITKMDNLKPLRPKIFIAKSPREILEGAKSKYLPVPLNLIFKEMKKLPGKYAIVALPCHIEGIHKAQKYIPWLEQKIMYKFGLFCSHTPTFNATKFLLRHSGVSPDTVKKISYRNGQHPSSMSIITSYGERIIDHKNWLYWGHNFYYYFWPRRCWLCPDKSAELADISFGDNWNRLSIMEHPNCFSRIILRNPDMEFLLTKIKKKGLLEIFQVTLETVNWDLKKKKNVGPRIFWEKKLGKAVPLYSRGILPKFNVLHILTIIPNVLRIKLTASKSIMKNTKYLFYADYCILTLWRYLQKLIFVILHPVYTIHYLIKAFKNKA